ncbi:MAG: ATP-binding protein [Candidatus Margulisiibacteriota bacterium]|jgi:signal transduction histidine kinase
MDPNEVLAKREQKLHTMNIFRTEGKDAELVRQKIQNILDISLLLNSHLKMDLVLQLALDTVMEVMKAAASSILLIDRKTGELVFEIARGGQGTGTQLQKEKFRLKPGEGIAGQVAQSGTPLLVADVEKDASWCNRIDNSSGFKTTSIICVPLKVKGQVTGVIEILNKTDGSLFDNDDLDYLALLANQVAVAVDNARVYGELEELNKNLQSIVDERTAELKKAYTELQKLDQMKSDFFNVVAHDLRSPLTAISGFSELILATKDNLNSDQVDGVTIIHQEVQRLNRLIDDLLGFAKMESGTLQFNMCVYDMRETIDQMFTVFSGEAKSRGVNLVKEMSADNFNIYGDKSKLAQVVANLISNAMKYTPRNGTVKIGLEKITENGQKLVRFFISDTGAGIPKEDLELIFLKFKQSSSPETKRVKGTGLGLYICKEFIGRHEGRVWAESEYGHGAQFYFTVAEK